MKKITFTLLLTLISIVSKAQNLSMSELLSLLGKDVSYVEEFLTEKGWEFTEYVDKDNEISSVTFDFLRGKTVAGEQGAASYITCYFNKEYQKINSIDIFFLHRPKYLEYISSIKTYGYKVIKSIYDKNFIGKLYAKGGKVVLASTMTENSSDEYGEVMQRTTWHLIVSYAESYQKRVEFAQKKYLQTEDN